MMKRKNTRVKKPSTVRQSYRQTSLFSSGEEFGATLSPSSQECQVVAVGKRRDGGTRYWCLRHKADATAKYGKPSKTCRASHISPISSTDILELNIDEYRGGIALWGAVPAVYDTTRLPMDRGIHVHARVTTDAQKEMDRTFRAVRVLSSCLPSQGILVSELDAIYYMVTSMFGYQMKHITCSYCDYSHLDRDWFSVHPHRRHLCAGCGKHFRDNEIAIGNPIIYLREASGVKAQMPTMSKKQLDIKQADYGGGIQIWGSNPAFLWTSKYAEEEGIHVHAFLKTGDQPDLDETYAQVTIDGVTLDPVMVRVLMAQNVLPSIKNRVLSVDCPSCQQPQFSLEELAFTPVSAHKCSQCGRTFGAPGRLRKTVANPLPKILAHLAEKAPRKPQQQDLGLLPETL